METMRKPFQGITNIVKFNWPYFAGSAILLVILISLNYIIAALIILLNNFLALYISYLVYDRSSLYQLTWLDDISIGKKNVNINAGFDETSQLIRNKYPDIDLKVLDFYDPNKHTETSIKRARKAYPPSQNILKINTSDLPFEDNSIDTVFAIFSLHEIRNSRELTMFFKELNRVIAPDGNIIIVEHLRDAVNFLAYNIGFFHFHSKATWNKAFAKANFHIAQTKKITPFVTVYILKKHETES